LGIRARAQPIDRLERKYDAFQHRLRIVSDEPVVDDIPVRTALAQTFESMSITAVDERETNNAPAFNVFHDDGKEEELDDGPARWPDFGLIVSSL
jgi:hypothetical protein